MDVAALFPNLKAKEIAREIAAAFNDIELKIDVDTHQLGLYLLLVLGKEELKKQGLSHVCPTRKATAGTERGITTAEVMGGQDCESKHNFARRCPTAGQRRRMVSLALEAGVIAVMTHHTYSFADSSADRVRLYRPGGDWGGGQGLHAAVGQEAAGGPEQGHPAPEVGPADVSALQHGLQHHAPGSQASEGQGEDGRAEGRG